MTVEIVNSSNIPTFGNKGQYTFPFTLALAVLHFTNKPTLCAGHLVAHHVHVRVADSAVFHIKPDIVWPHYVPGDCEPEI